MVYDMTKPTTVIFDMVDNQCKLEELAGKYYTPSQILDLAFLAISNYSSFRDNVRRWLCHPPTDQTYPDIVSFFQEVHVELHEIEASVNKLGFQLANAILTQIVDQLRSEMGANNLPTEEPERSAEIFLPIDQDVNVALTTQDNTKNAVIKTMMENMESMGLHLEQAESRTAQPFSGGW